MLHERHVYARDAARHILETNEKGSSNFILSMSNSIKLFTGLWYRLVYSMKLRLDAPQLHDVADASFTLFYWLHSSHTTLKKS